MNRNILLHQIPPHQTFVYPQANQFLHPTTLSYSPLQKVFQNSTCLKEINSFKNIFIINSNDLSMLSKDARLNTLTKDVTQITQVFRQNVLQ